MTIYLIRFLFIFSLTSVSIEAMTGTSFPPQSKISTQPPAPTAPAPTAPAPTVPHHKPLAKPVLPSMLKPYQMPGVVGLQNNQWVGSDYLGFLSSSLSVNVEIMKTDQVSDLVSSEELEQRVTGLMSKEGFKPNADVKEGPPLPYIQILLFIYPAEKGKFVIFGACRLFEQIQVMRKSFTPSGYWQGITWESQNVVLASDENLKDKILSLVDGLMQGFIKRYKLFNPENKPSSTNEEQAS